MVRHSKMSIVVAEELAALEVKLAKSNFTRWNSHLFQYRSILRLTPADLQLIRNAMPSKSEKQRQIQRNFGLTPEERETLQELVDVLMY